MLLPPIAITEASHIPLMIVILLAATAAFAIGYLLGRRRGHQPVQSTDDAERQEMLRLIQELGSAANEHAGQVSKVQEQINALSQHVNDAPAGEVAATSSQIIELLQQFVHNNGQLKARLDAVEVQLDQKTRQVEGYAAEARTDSITGLSNRRAFDDQLDELFKNYRSGGRSFVVSLIDIDYFKSVNDSQGHQVGDLALRAIAKMLTEELPDALMVTRFGGDEFAVIFDGPMNRVAKKMDHLRRTLHQRGLRIESSKLDSTISVGISEPSDDLAIGSLLRRADEALYAAKNFGRNRVYYHDGQSPALVDAPKTARNA